MNVPELRSYRGRSPRGTWTLEVRDEAYVDVGSIKRFGVELVFAPPVRVEAATATRSRG